MSENITHTAVVDDCARLACHSPHICEAFKECLEKHLEIARLGGVTRSGGKFMPPLLEKYREAWPRRAKGSVLEQKLAFVLGWHFHRAADLQMKPVFKAADPNCALDPTDCSVYHDVFLFREIYGDGRKEPYARAAIEANMASAPGASAFKIEEIEDVFRCLLQRALIGLHTFIPAREDADAWLEQLFKTRQRFYVAIRRYAEAFAAPDPDKMKRFIADVNFYNRADPLIRLAQSLRDGAADKTIDPDKAIASAATQSHYAQALRRGCLYVHAASEYFDGRIDQAAYKDRLGRGAQGVE